MRTDRRTFVKTALAAGVAAPAVLRRRERRRYPIAFSTLGCPAWSWSTILQTCRQPRLRRHRAARRCGRNGLDEVPELTGSRLAATKKDLAAIGVEISDLGASADDARRPAPPAATALDEGRRFIDLAQAMGVKYVRMFGDQIPPGEPREAVFARVIEGFQQMAAHARAPASSC